MGFQFHRFYNDEKQNLRSPWEKNDTQKHLEKPLPVYSVSAALLKPEGGGVGVGDFKNQSTNTTSTFGKLKVSPENHKQWHRRILDPGSDVVLQWNRIFLFFCLVALFVDPLFFYVPMVVNNASALCMTTDLRLGIVITCFRTIADIFYMLHIVIKSRTAFVSPSSRVFGRGELVMDPKMILRRYLRSDFLVDLIAALPLPQVLQFGFTVIHVQLILWFCRGSKQGKRKTKTNLSFIEVYLEFGYWIIVKQIVKENYVSLYVIAKWFY